MNLTAAHVAALDTVDRALDAELAGLDALDGVKKKLKKVTRGVRKVSLADKVHQVNRKVVKKVTPKPVYRLKKKTERVAKRNALTLVAAAATIATGGAAAPALIAAAQKAAGSEAMRAGVKRRTQVQQRKAVKAADAEADRQAADYEAELNRQDAAASLAPAANVVPLRRATLAPSTAPEAAMTGDYIPRADAEAADAKPAGLLPGVDNKYLAIGAAVVGALLLLRR